MSQTVRKQLFHVVDLLEKANKVLEKKLFAGKVEEDAVVQLLTDCQDSAISMGEQIEKIYGENTKTVAVLEQYCESLYQISQCMYERKQAREVYQTMGKQLKKMRSQMVSEIPDKKEVVFLPYKASMWDSLESVWLEARDNENCDAYVIPIPYYDKNPDGSFREEHYEGDEYPDYVPITNYNEYDFETRRPDEIYIHNPYDEGNYVTSVHPFFYSSNLKNFTEKLVYIPYFVLAEIDPDDKMAVEGMKHFCLQSGVVNAHKVIVQSEKMRQVYINVLTEATGENQRTYWEQKIEGSGSPKIKKVVNTKKEDLEIPDEWLKIIQKPDGSWKKIILYNNSVTALLEHKQQMLDKMKRVFEIFYERRDDVALLWRPHPLIESTLTSMRPELWEEYQKIKEKYLSEKWGIYDDSPELDRAIVLSDAYYGDESSIIQLFKHKRKPIMLQNVLKSKNGLLWSVTGFEIDNDELWFVSYWNSFLCCYSLKEERIKIIEPVPKAQHIECAYCNIAISEDIVILIPCCANNIAFYDKKEKKFFFKEFSEKNVKFDKFFGYKIWNNNLYLFGIRYPAILKMDLSTKEIAYLTEWTNKIKTGLMSICFQTDYYIDKCKVYMLSALENQVMIFNVETEKSEILKIGEEGAVYSTITKIDKNLFLLTTQNGDCVIADIQHNSFVKTKNELSNFIPYRYDNRYSNFMDAIRHGEDIYFFPGQANKIVKYSLKDNMFEEKHWFEDCIGDMTCKGNLFSKIKEIDDYLYGFELETNLFWKFNLQTKAIKYFEIKMEMLDENLRLQIMQKVLAEQPIKETDYLSLEAYINVLK